MFLSNNKVDSIIGCISTSEVFFQTYTTHHEMDFMQSKITTFQCLPNELICEIFKYFNITELLEIFSPLNYQLYSLIHCYDSPIKLNFPISNELTFNDYSNTIIQHFQHNIHSIYLVNPFIFERLSFSSFPRLRILILENIAAEKFLEIHSYLSNLSLLSIKLADHIKHPNYFYNKILGLSHLKYLKISEFEPKDNVVLFPNTCNLQYNSSLAKLVIDHKCSVQDLILLLHYVPKLRYLSCRKLRGSTNFVPTNVEPIVLNHLKYLSLKTAHVNFDQLEFIFENFSHQIEIFRFSAIYQVDYFDAIRWQHFIQSKLPQLRRFHLEILSDKDTPTPISYVSITSFMSSFWLEHRWHFRYECQPNNAAFHSIDSYDQATCYELHSRSYEETVPSHELTPTIFSRVNHLIHSGNISNRTNQFSFSNTTDLTIRNYENTSLHSISTILKRFMSLPNLSQLTIDHQSFCITQFIDLLYFCPCIRVLNTYHCFSFSKVSLALLAKTTTFQTILKQNQIQTITMKWSPYREMINLFNKLCPRLQQMIVECDETDHYYRSFNRGAFSWLNSNHNRIQAPFICFINYPVSNRFHRSLLPVPLSYMMNTIGTNMYFWST